MASAEVGKNLGIFPAVTVFFDRDETLQIAEGAYVAALIAAVIPEPLISKVFSVSTKACSIWAKSAVRRGKCIGVMYQPLPSLWIPFEYRPQKEGGEAYVIVAPSDMNLGFGGKGTAYLLDENETRSIAGGTSLSSVIGPKIDPMSSAFMAIAGQSKSLPSKAAEDALQNGKCLGIFIVKVTLIGPSVYHPFEYDPRDIPSP